MLLLRFDNAALAKGRDAFNAYAAAAVCGPEADVYAPGMYRDRGVGVVAGAILASIEAGMTTESAIVHAAARVSCCRRSTAQSMLQALTGDDPRQSLWAVEDGRYRAHQADEAGGRRFMLAA